MGVADGAQRTNEGPRTVSLVVIGGANGIVYGWPKDHNDCTQVPELANQQPFACRQKSTPEAVELCTKLLGMKQTFIVDKFKCDMAKVTVGIVLFFLISIVLADDVFVSEGASMPEPGANTGDEQKDDSLMHRILSFGFDDEILSRYLTEERRESVKTTVLEQFADVRKEFVDRLDEAAKFSREMLDGVVDTINTVSNNRFIVDASKGDILGVAEQKLTQVLGFVTRVPQLKKNFSDSIVNAIRDTAKVHSADLVKKKCAHVSGLYEIIRSLDLAMIHALTHENFTGQEGAEEKLDIVLNMIRKRENMVRDVEERMLGSLAEVLDAFSEVESLAALTAEIVVEDTKELCDRALADLIPRSEDVKKRLEKALGRPVKDDASQ